ncbi:MAG: valine--tRNA ligase, partial [bacterium]
MDIAKDNTDFPQDSGTSLPKHIDPTHYEAKWYQRWMDAGCFSTHPEAAPSRFCIVIPPPNITGSLHMGHALNLSLQDAIIRHKKLTGADVLWLPGTDHAGIATQNVVEKQLMDEGTHRADLGRERFEQRVWEWKETAQGRINDQLRKLGAAVDWRMERFTFDEQCCHAVRQAFKTLYDEGLIYKDMRIINWCPRCKTALSDIEVEFEEEGGALYYVSYPVEGTSEAIVVATTRPETMLGDSAVAVNPDDERYKKFHDKMVTLPLVGRSIPVITDDYVDRQFGTGALKITPAHDPYDFEIGKKHNLPAYCMMDEDGVITSDYPAYTGMDRFACRVKVAVDLKSQGLLVKQEVYRHSVGHCYRCGIAIEPYLSLQWFVRMKELAEPAAQAVRDGRTRFLPDRWTKVYLNWMDNIRDWCISRQLWWGHRIPVWTCADCGDISASVTDIQECPNCSSRNISQEDDVLDTWFSSGLWPLSTLGWPNSTPALKTYYPTSILVTGFDIIFFWVARMMMFGLKFGGDVPFRDVLIHGIVRDAEGTKMSKSYGNVIDPLDIIDEYGADSLRFSCLSSAGMGQDVYLSDEKFRSGRNLCNKLWNAARFILMTAPEPPSDLQKALSEAALDLSDRWILSRAKETLDEALALMEQYDLAEALHKIYAFFWHDFCDWYLEIAKNRLKNATEAEHNMITSILHYLLRWILTLFHPFIPFITEEIWQALPVGARHSVPLLAEERYPQFDFAPDDEAIRQMTFIQGLIRNVRDIRASLSIPPKTKIELLVSTDDSHKIQTMKICESYISSLSGVSRIQFGRIKDKDENRYATCIIDGVEIFVPVPSEMKDGETERLEKRRKTLSEELVRIEGKLQNESFVQKAPREVVQKEREKLVALRDDLNKITERL